MFSIPFFAGLLHLILWAGLTLGPVHAQTSAVPAVGSGSVAAAPGASAVAQLPAELRAWFMRMQTAAQTANYRGTLVSSASGTMSSSRVDHYRVGDSAYETVEALDGHPQRILRHNDEVHTLWPNSRVAVIERRETLAAWTTTPQAVDPLALEHYEMRLLGNSRVAGRDAVVFALEPRDNLRYRQRLWADRESGLILRADVLQLPAPPSTAAAGAPAAPAAALSAAPPGASDPQLDAMVNSQVLISTAFSSVDIGIKPQHEAIVKALQQLQGYRILRPQQRRTTLQDEGWVLARPVAGYRLAGCVLRGMENAGGKDPVLQAVFTDGLTHVSLFVERFQPELHKSPSSAQRGATASLAQRGGEHWFTVVGDVPPRTLQLFAAALDRRSP